MEKEIKEFINGTVRYDKEGQYFWVVDKDGGMQMLAELRGWGRIQNMFKSQDDAATFQDKLGEFIADAINKAMQPSTSLPKSVGEVNMDEIANAYVKSQGSHYKPENTKHDFVNGFLAGYQSAGQGREWVSVEKAIPEIGQMVLVYNTEGAILTGRLMNNGWSAFFSDGECLMQELTATHWQPVPSPPNNISTDGLENGEK